MGRPRSATWHDQREQILAAAAEQFATRGYTATTMSGVARAAGVGKATLYHYVRDKHDLLAQIARGHMAVLEALVAEVDALALPPRARLAELTLRFVRAYASAAHRHRVLTEDVKFLEDAEREEVLAAERRVVAAFADAVAALRPELARERLAKPLAMLLFGMINWTFTWMRPEGALTHEALAPLVVDLYLGGLDKVKAPTAGAAASKRAPAGARRRRAGAAAR